MSYYLRWLFDAFMTPVRALMYAPGKLFTSSRRLLGMSLPARVAFTVGLLLIICVVISWIIFLRDENSSFFPSLLNYRGYALSLTVLIFVIPFLTYHILWLWIEGDASPFVDIDAAWQAGLAELQRHGLDLSEIPLFLILGSSDPQQEKAIIEACRLSLNVREVPVGPAALHWYANREGAYLFCSTVGSLSHLAATAQVAAASRPLSPAGPLGLAPAPPSEDALFKTFLADKGGPPPSMPQDSAPSVSERRPPDADEQEPVDNLRGTMLISSGSLRQGMLAGKGRGRSASLGGNRPITLSRDDAANEERRLEYLCQLIRRVRQPVCPGNGLLTLLPYSLLARGDSECDAIQQALAGDLGVVARVFMLRCPVTAVVVGMEAEAGFRELVRRVGRDPAANQRFGRGYRLNNLPTVERLQALTAHAAGAFEDWVYNLFRERGSLSKPGNSRLYALLCRIRHTVQQGLSRILSSAFSADSVRDAHTETFFFSGCYFSAVGESEDRQAFIRAVMQKLPQLQGELQWTEGALRAERRLQTVAQFLFGLDFLLLAGLVGMVLYWKWWY